LSWHREGLAAHRNVGRDARHRIGVVGKWSNGRYSGTPRREQAGLLKRQARQRAMPHCDAATPSGAKHV